MSKKTERVRNNKMSIANYNEEVKKRVEWVKNAKEFSQTDKEAFEYNVYQLLEYLKGLDWFEEEERKNSPKEIKKQAI